MCCMYLNFYNVDTLVPSNVNIAMASVAFLLLLDTKKALLTTHSYMT